MVQSYNHKKIEKKWQAIWEKKKIYQAKDFSQKPKFYGLIEFPYPSGAGLHVGHIRSNTAMDIISRKKRMEGYNVLYPIGWDAFGLPTENYAIKSGIHPIKVTKDNTDTFRRQLKALGFSFDWSREINTTDPKYYKWTQWIFLQLFKKGLAYKAKTEINWCPSCKIGLANEEVVGGNCERCGGPTEKREKEQWMLAITKYADRLDKDLDTVDYLEKIKIQQRNWIGKSEGAEIEFKISSRQDLDMKVFTTRADTLFGATYVVLAPEHSLVGNLKSQIRNWDEVLQYIVANKKKTDIERTAEDKVKTGVELKGVKVINPATKEEIPVWIADYVLVHYGTGAIMAVPGHDERDFEFAKKYNLPIKYVVAPYFYDKENPPRSDKKDAPRKAVKCFVRNPKDNTYLCIEWNKNQGVDWRTTVSGGVEEDEDIVEAGKREIEEEAGYKNLKFIKYLGVPERVDFYHLPKDENRLAEFHGLLFELENEEQNTINKIETAKHIYKWIKEEKVLGFINHGAEFFKRILNNDIDVYTGKGVLINSNRFNGLDDEKAKKEITKFVGGKNKTTYKLRDWVFSRQRYWGEPIPLIHCEKCGFVPVPDKDLPVLLPKVAQYKPTDDGESPLASIKSWVNVKCPKCKGRARRETDTMPNWAGSSWYYLRYADPKNKKEFASKKNLNYWVENGVDWYNGGMEHTTLHLLYSRFWHKFLYDLKLVPTSEPYAKRTSHGLILADDGTKFSKSKGNGVNPEDLVKIYGAYTLRMYEMFMGPFDQSVSWNTDGMVGPRRFLERVWRLGIRVASRKNFSGQEIQKLLHKTIKKVSEDIEEMHFNTAISSMMVFVNEMEKIDIAVSDYKKFLQILSPFAPHLAEELWNILREKKSINLSIWPKWDASAIIDEEIKIVIQINGKMRAEMMIQTDEDEESVKHRVFDNEVVFKYTAGKDIKRMIYIKNRLINIVL